MSRQRVISVPEWGYLGARHTLVSRNIATQGGGRGDGRKSVGYKSRRKGRKLPENLIVIYGEVNRQSDYPTVKQESHPPPKKPLPMNPLASPVTEWGAPGAYTRSQILDPHNVPN